MICKKCGSVIGNEDKFCPNCGTKVEIEQSKSTQKICPNCHSAVLDTDEFCNNCGHKLKGEKKETVHVTPSRTQNKQAKKKKNENLSIILVFLGTVLVVGGIIYFLFIRPNQSNPTSSTTSTEQTTEKPLSVEEDNLTLEVGESDYIYCNYDEGVTYITKDKNIASVSKNGKVKGIKEGKTSIIVKRKDEKLTVKIEVIKEENINLPQTTGDYILPDSQTKALTEQDLQGLSKEQLRLARNEIYARHGRKFTDATLQKYFESKSWYKGTIDADKFDESVLSTIEKQNADFIKAHEAQ